MARRAINDRGERGLFNARVRARKYLQTGIRVSTLMRGKCRVDCDEAPYTWFGFVPARPRHHAYACKCDGPLSLLSNEIVDVDRRARDWMQLQLQSELEPSSRGWVTLISRRAAVYASRLGERARDLFFSFHLSLRTWPFTSRQSTRRISTFVRVSTAPIFFSFLLRPRPTANSRDIPRVRNWNIQMRSLALRSRQHAVHYIKLRRRRIVTAGAAH